MDASLNAQRSRRFAFTLVELLVVIGIITILIAILYDDNFDGTVDRRDEIPGAHPKIEMPTTMDPTANSNIPPDKASDKTPAKKKK